MILYRRIDNTLIVLCTNTEYTINNGMSDAEDLKYLLHIHRDENIRRLHVFVQPDIWELAVHIMVGCMGDFKLNGYVKSAMLHILNIGRQKTLRWVYPDWYPNIERYVKVIGGNHARFSIGGRQHAVGVAKHRPTPASPEAYRLCTYDYFMPAYKIYVDDTEYTHIDICNNGKVVCPYRYTRL